MRGKAEGSALLEARWLGACKPDQRPGDYILSNGVKLRVSDPKRKKLRRRRRRRRAAAEQAAKEAKADGKAQTQRRLDARPETT